jgi:predicted nucleotidyltransferase
VQDVERASREVHVLTPTQYEASLRKRNLEENRDATDKNAGLVFAQSEEQEKEKEWEERQRAMVKVMRIFGSARQGD